MKVNRQVVMVDPGRVKDKSLLPEAIARVEYISDLHHGIAIVYFDELGIYNAYKVSELLAIFPEKLIFQNLCINYYKLNRAEIDSAFNLVTHYQKRNYENAFRIALKNPAVSQLCMTDYGTFLKMTREASPV